MKILGNNASKLNEVIFENRNKNYGAYSIRQSYNDSLFKSLFYLSSMLILLFGTLYLYNKLNPTSILEKAILLNDPKLDLVEYITKLDITPIEKPIRNEQAATAPKGTIGTRIVDNPIETNTVVNLNNPISGVGSSTATGLASAGTETAAATTITFVSNNSSNTSVTFIIAEEMPEFEGGDAGLMKFIGQNIVYPDLAKSIGVEGKVYVSFIVNELGNVENAKVEKGMGFGCDEEVLRVIRKMPRWKKPGRNAGHAVKVKYNVPIAFKLK